MKLEINQFNVLKIFELKICCDLDKNCFFFIIGSKLNDGFMKLRAKPKFTLISPEGQNKTTHFTPFVK